LCQRECDGKATANELQLALHKPCLADRINQQLQIERMQIPTIKNWLAVVAVLVNCMATASARAGELEHGSLCSSNETVYFSCKIERTREYASICAKDNVSPDTGYVQYRFGRDQDAAFKFPNSKVPPGASFHIQTINHFHDGLGKHVTFKNGSYTYIVSSAVQPPEIGIFRGEKLIATKECEFDGGFSTISNEADFGIKQGEKSTLDTFDGS
jgi:hypothetical protein